MLSKNEHRQRLILLRNELGITRNKTLSLSIQQTFLAEFESNPSVQTIGLYAPTNVEVQLDLISKKFIDMGRTITWPVIRPNYSLRFIAINQTKKFGTLFIIIILNYYCHNVPVQILGCILRKFAK